MSNSDKQEFELKDLKAIADLLSHEAHAALESSGSQVVGVRVEGSTDLAQTTSLVSEVREAYDENQASLKRRASLGDVVAGITHQSRNIMTGVLSFSQIARHRNSDPKLSKLLESIENESMRCVELMNQILTLARSREATINGSYEQMSLAETIVSACRLSQPRMANNDIRIENSLGDSTLEILGDKNALRDVFVNLLRNATDATPGGGVIRVSAEFVDEFAVVYFDDSGPGVAPEDREMVFEASFTTKRAGQGTGLGLAVSRQVVIEHKGDLLIEDSPLGGARFVVRLPRAVEKGETR